MLQAFVDEPSIVECHTLRRVICSGEALSSELAKQFHSVLNIPLHNLYGPTEAAVDVSYWECLPSSNVISVPIGRPVWNTKLYVLDGQLQPSPVGVPGELYLAGVQLARGYLKRFSLTAERFVADPHGEPGDRMYRTGDVVRWRSDAALEYIGRSDHQVKIRGFRIELGEIETQLLRHHEVAQVAVIAHEIPSGDKRLIAYLVPKDITATIDCAFLRDSLRQSLPDYMVPSELVVLDKLPLSANGKLDRNALPNPGITNSSANALRRGPRTPQEEIVCSIFAELLGMPRVGIDDNFFEAGGHSLLAVRLISRLRSTLGVQISIRTLFEAPTVALLIQRFDSDTFGDPLDVLLPLRPRGDSAPLFCVHPIGGLSWSYAGLMPQLPSTYPIYGLQARGINGPASLPPTLEEMTADYVMQIREIQPKGPYHLIGWSFGGLVAFAAATQLQREGEEIGLLSLLDTYPHTQEKQKEIRDMREVLSIIFEDLGYSVGDEEPDFATLKRKLEKDGSVLSVFEEHHLAAMVNVFWNNDRIARHFQPCTYEGDVLFFSATRDREEEWPLPETWGPYVTGRIKVYPVDCGHRQMTDSLPLATIGSVIASELEKQTNYKGEKHVQSV